MGLTVTPLFLSLSSFLLLFKLFSSLSWCGVRWGIKKLGSFVTWTKKKPLPSGQNSTGFVRYPSPSCAVLEGIPLGWAILLSLIRWWTYWSSTTLVPHTTSSTDPWSSLHPAEEKANWVKWSFTPPPQWASHNWPHVWHPWYPIPWLQLQWPLSW